MYKCYKYNLSNWNIVLIVVKSTLKKQILLHEPVEYNIYIDYRYYSFKVDEN